MIAYFLFANIHPPHWCKSMRPSHIPHSQTWHNKKGTVTQYNIKEELLPNTTTIISPSSIAKFVPERYIGVFLASFPYIFFPSPVTMPQRSLTPLRLARCHKRHRHWLPKKSSCLCAAVRLDDRESGIRFDEIHQRWLLGNQPFVFEYQRRIISIIDTADTTNISNSSIIIIIIIIIIITIIIIIIIITTRPVVTISFYRIWTWNSSVLFGHLPLGHLEPPQVISSKDYVAAGQTLPPTKKWGTQGLMTTSSIQMRNHSWLAPGATFTPTISSWRTWIRTPFQLQEIVVGSTNTYCRWYIYDFEKCKKFPMFVENRNEGFTYGCFQK